MASFLALLLSAAAWAQNTPPAPKAAAGAEPLLYSPESANPSGPDRQSQDVPKVIAAVDAYARALSMGRRGKFTLADASLRRNWELESPKLSPTDVRPMFRNWYLASAHCRAADGSDLLVDFHAERTRAGFHVRRALIHAVNGKPRFQYGPDFSTQPIAPTR